MVSGKKPTYLLEQVVLKTGKSFSFAFRRHLDSSTWTNACLDLLGLLPLHTFSRSAYDVER